MERFFKFFSILIFISTLLFFNSFSQNPLIKQWDKRYGGTDNEWLTDFHQTADGGYILGGRSNSGISGDKTEGLWVIDDYWIVKLDPLGNKEWDRRFGGTSIDWLYAVRQTVDKGYILGGLSRSGISGDKTQPNWDTTNTTLDYWIVKTDSLGVKQWDKRFGGTNDDQFYSLQETADGGYILGGYSHSGIGGDKTQAPKGPYDYWIVKIDSLGIKQWDKVFGGSGSNYFYSLDKTNDGGYILGGYSNSGISGDKTQPSQGLFDYWVVKTDSLGMKQWDKTFGGINSDKLFYAEHTTDGGYILGGFSSSGISGDKTQNTWGFNDYWIVKIDSIGNKQWDKDFGGGDEEEDFGNVLQTSEGGYLVAGTSYSNVSGDKTENNLGIEQMWIVKTDSLGNKQWDKTIYNTGHDEMGFTIRDLNGCFVFANATNSAVGGYKTQPNWDPTHTTQDYWIVKFCDSVLTSGLESFSKGIKAELFPNPANGSVRLSINNKYNVSLECEIVNVMGVKVYKFQIPNSNVQTNLDVSFLAKGIYMVRLGNGDRSENKKMVIE